jgi:hypothetical protein
MIDRTARLGTVTGDSGARDIGHVALPPAIHVSMAARSYVWPFETTTGSRMTARETGHLVSGGMSSDSTR